MNITIESRINVDGTWWDLTTEHIVQPGGNSAEKVENIKKIVRGLASVGLISRVAISASPPAKPERVPQAQFVPNDREIEEDETPPPFCPVHREAMSVSKVQKKKGHTEFYCRLKTGDGEYCKNRATLPDWTAIPKFWSVQ